MNLLLNISVAALCVRICKHALAGGGEFGRVIRTVVHQHRLSRSRY